MPGTGDGQLLFQAWMTNIIKDKPKSDGLQPTIDGLHPTSDGLHTASLVQLGV